MFTIRSDQIRRMEASFHEEYAQKIQSYLKQAAPELTFGYKPDDLHERIVTAAARARALGLTTAEGVIGFVGLALAAGPAFEQDGQVHRFLTLPGHDADSKVRWLFQRVVQILKQDTGIDTRR
jgi:hypothetical protein